MRAWLAVRYEGKKRTARELASLLGIEPPAVSQLLRAREPTRPSFATAESMAKLIGVSIDVLLGGSSRIRALELLRAPGVAPVLEEAIVEVMREPEMEPRPVLFWVDRIRTLSAAFAAGFGKK